MNLFKPQENLPEAEANPEIEALDALLRSQDKQGAAIDVSLDALVRHGQDRMVVRSDVSTNADGAGGGATETRTQPTIVDSLKAYGAAINLIPIIETPDGNAMSWPVTDNTSQEGEMLANEGTAITSQDPKAITTKSLAVNRFSSKFVPISNTLIQDSVFDITSYATMLCARRIGRTISSKIVSAPLTDGIDGFKSIATQVEVDAKTGITFPDELVELVHKIDRAYLSSEGGMGSNLSAGSGLTSTGGYVGFIGSYEMLRVLKIAKDTQNRPLWQPNFRVGEPSMVMGQPFTVVDELDGFGTQGNVPLMFGNFTYMQGRFAKNITIERFYDSGTAAGDYTSFLGLARFGMRSIITEVASQEPRSGGGCSAELGTTTAGAASVAPVPLFRRITMAKSDHFTVMLETPWHEPIGLDAPTDQQWSAGVVIRMQSSIAGPLFTMASGEFWLVDPAFGARLVERGRARYETERETACAKAVGYKRPSAKPGVKAAAPAKTKAKDKAATPPVPKAAADKGGRERGGLVDDPRAVPSHRLHQDPLRHPRGRDRLRRAADGFPRHGHRRHRVAHPPAHRGREREGPVPRPRPRARHRDVLRVRREAHYRDHGRALPDGAGQPWFRQGRHAEHTQQALGGSDGQGVRVQRHGGRR